MNVEQEAAALGWKPKEEFRGNPEKWVDAATYVERGQTVLPILRENNKTLQRELATQAAELVNVKATLKEATEAMAEFRAYHDATAKREYERARKDLLAQKTAALAEGAEGAATVVAVDEAIRELDDAAEKAPKPKPASVQAPAPAPTSQPVVHPDYPQWVKDNQSWLSDPEKQAYGGAISAYIRAMHPRLEGRPFLDLVTAEVEKHFDTGRSGGSRVEGGGGAPPSRGGGPGDRSYANLPADAKAACDKDEARLVGPNKAFKTREEWRKEYVTHYDWS